MSAYHSSPSEFAGDRARLERLGTAIRGKLQFMDYLVRAALADLDRLEGEADPGTQIFLRQLIEMHSASLTVEVENMGLLGEFCSALETSTATGVIAAGPFRNGDAA